MKKARFTTEQIIAILQDHAAGAAPAALMRHRDAALPDFLDCYDVERIDRSAASSAAPLPHAA